MAPSGPIIRYSTRANSVYAALKAEIISLKLLPGSMVQEDALAQRLGVSRTPVREALRRLEQEGLVKTIPKKGSLVAGVSLSDIREVLQVRLACEPLAARLAAEAMPPEEIGSLLSLHAPTDAPPGPGPSKYREMHRSIARHCGNRRLEAILLSLLDDTARIVMATDIPTQTLVREQHARIIEAIRLRDGAMAEQAMHDHILAFQQALSYMLIR